MPYIPTDGIIEQAATCGRAVTTPHLSHPIMSGWSFAISERNPVRAQLVTEQGNYAWSTAKHRLAPDNLKLDTRSESLG
jgi:hypothetical protein